MKHIWLKNLPILCREAVKFDINIVIMVDKSYEDIDGDTLIAVRLDTENPLMHKMIWDAYMVHKESGKE